MHDPDDGRLAFYNDDNDDMGCGQGRGGHGAARSRERQLQQRMWMRSWHGDDEAQSLTDNLDEFDDYTVYSNYL